MTKKELIEAYKTAAGDACSSTQQATRQLNSMFEVLAESLHREGRLRWDGFGTFELKQRPARTVRNPQTGQPLKVKASKAVGFKAATALRERVQKAPRKAKAA